jgi:serine/threonine protein kinase
MFKEYFSQIINVAANQLFGDLEADYMRFDFDGNGMLEVNEVYKLAKFYLWEYRKAHGGRGPSVNIPTQSLESTGYKVVKELGAGTQGVAFLATNRLGDEVCVKKIRKEKLAAGGVDELKEEFETMQILACERIARVFEIFQDSIFVYLVGEAYTGGDFSTIQTRAKAAGISTSLGWWRGICWQCFQALEFMHEQAMMHCDIKEENLMIKTGDFQKPRIVIIDFGVSQAVVSKIDAPCGTPGYIPPETFEKMRWYPRGDIFSMAVTVMQVLIYNEADVRPLGSNGKPNRRGIFVDGCSGLREIAMATTSREPPWQKMPFEFAQLTELLKTLLVKKVELRPRAPQVLDHAFFGIRGDNSRGRVCTVMAENILPSTSDGSGRNKSKTGRAGTKSYARRATMGITDDFLAELEAEEEEEVESKDTIGPMVESPVNRRQRPFEMKSTASDEVLHLREEVARLKEQLAQRDQELAKANAQLNQFLPRRR